MGKLEHGRVAIKVAGQLFMLIARLIATFFKKAGIF